MKRERRDIFVWICLIAVVTLFRYVTVLADFYALHIYPYISYVLSLEASVISYSLEEIVVLFIVFVFIVNIIRSVTKRITWKECFRKEFKLMALTYVWFYIGWGINYSRSSLTERVEVEKEEFDKDAFMSFLSEYTDSLNSLYVEQVTYQPIQTEAAIKDYFQSVPKKYGLCKPRDWHHSKRTLLNGLYSGSGVYGFMGPFFNESQLNSDLLPVQYPFTMAHEYSHLLGVSNEAEANWWAFQACSSQKDSTIRYSAWYSLFVHVWNNAYELLDEEEFNEWRSTVRTEILAQIASEQSYWQEKRFGPLDTTQRFIYEIFLKGNGIPSGMKNYSEVIGLLITLDKPK